ncbi:TPA: hypothetical protein ACPFK7_003761 [Proteus mirabilis]|uniref:hypothetical protein n=1 Tax=Proteus TaxID=583 RepID=UPI0021B0DEF7|nr:MULTISPECIES: hypothetical protein [Proteus]MCT6516557.1 hypothetical protein [Proteus vulgaris]MDS0823296.1 hypothetical protein [Proteus mirabilis]
MKNELSISTIKDRDVYKSSSEKLLLLIPKSRSKNHPLAMKYASVIDSVQVYIEEQLFTICYIDLTNHRDCEVAQKIINISSGWKGFSAVFKGMTITSFHLSYRVLPCIKEALCCTSKKAHCSKMATGNSYIREHRYVDYQICNFDLLLPCKLADMGFYEPHLDVSINDQYQAMAVRMGVNWCPFFNADDIKIIDRDPVIKGENSSALSLDFSGATALLSIDISDFKKNDE